MATTGQKLTQARLWWAVLLVFAVSSLSGRCGTRHVVVLYDERTELPGLAVIDSSIRRALASGPEHVEIYREAMDNSRFGSAEYRNLLRDHFRAKYAGRRIDVAMAVMGPALDFLLSHKGTLFADSPEVPIVFCGIDRRTFGDRPLPAGVTGVLLKREFAPTLELCLSLHPDTERIVVVSGSSDFDRKLVEHAKEEFRAFEKRVAFTYSAGKPLRELLAELSRLPPRTVVLYTTMFRDGANEAHVPHEAAGQISAAANAPVYGFVDQYVGRGIVGGRLYSLSAHGEAAGGLVLKILAGSSAAEILPLEPQNSVTMFDWRQLKRWKISENNLPSGSKVLFRQQTVWQAYKNHVVGIGALIAMQAAVISILLANLIKRRRAERSLVESEERFRNVANTAPVMIWMTGADKSCTFLNTSWLRFRGRTMEEELGDGWAEGIHPEDYKRSLETYTESFDARRSFTMEYRLRKYNGEYRWVLDSGVPRVAADGTFLGYTGSVVDISTMKETEAELRTNKERMTLAAEAAHLGMWLWDVPANRLWLSDKCRELFGFSSDDEVTYETMLRRIHPEDRQAEDKAVRRAIANKAGYEMEYRLLLPDGVVRWIAASGRVDYDGQVTPARILGICIDISERRRAEESARELSGRFINAQEDERRRIARDLHDDLNQRLALLSVEMELFGRRRSGDAKSPKQFEQLAAHVKEISSEVHKISYELHPAKLDQLGLVAAARAFCRETSQRSGVRVDFVPGNVTNKLPGDVALCLYRVLQESIQNVVRHSGAKAAQANLMMRDSSVHLVVADSGKGFDVDHARKNGGLGLVSMEERIRLVHGTIAVRSQPGAGTRVELSVPVPDLQQHD